jgi:hypothetical protein
MERGDQLQKIRQQMTRGDFEKKYTHMWVIRELEADERAPSSFNTVAWDARKTLAVGKKLRSSGMGMIARLRLEPGRYGLYAVIKSGANPWADRILIGRASNNDIVFRHESVSKVHAYFERNPEGVLRLFDAKSANGTRVDGRQIEPGEGCEVRTGAELHFGSLACEFLDSGELFDAL